MTAQEIFDKVVAHLRKQNSKSVEYNDDGSVRLQWNGNADSPVCAYRSRDGKKCAAGVMISDEAYVPAMEGMNIAAVISLYNIDDLRPHEHLLLDLQRVHDNSVVSDWETGFEGVANRHALTYTPHTL